MIIIKCAKCNGKIFKYIKIGKCRLLHCWKDRIAEDLSVHNGNNIECNCGVIIGIDKGKESDILSGINSNSAISTAKPNQQ